MAKRPKRRKYKDNPYQVYFERRKTAGDYSIPPRNGVSIFQETYDAVREILMQAVDRKEDAGQ